MNVTPQPPDPIGSTPPALLIPPPPGGSGSPSDSLPPLPPSPDSQTKNKNRLDRYDKHIELEFQLTAQRMTYLAMSEAFLFSAYVLALANLEKNPTLLGQVIHAVPWLGIAMAASVFLAVIGAISMIFKLKAERERIEESADDLRVHRDTGWKSLEHFIGLIPPVVISGAFIIAWLWVWPSTRDAQVQAAGAPTNSATATP